MKTTSPLIATLACLALSASSALADPELFDDGIDIGNTYNSVLPYYSGMSLTSWFGGIFVNAGQKEVAAWSGDGGVYLMGKPVRIVLGASHLSGSDYTDGTFEVWAQGNAWGVANAVPAFKINTDPTVKSATFAGVDVAVNKNASNQGGNLTVAGTITSTGALNAGGSPVLTQSSIKALPKFEFGSTAVAVGNAYSLGTSTTAGGYYSLAAGNGSIAWGTASAAIGFNNTAAGDYAVALGGYSTTNSGYAFAAGAYSHANSYASTALGGSTAGGVYATALSNGLANGYYSFAAGIGTDAESYGAVSLGLYPVQYTASATTLNVPLDPLFSLGNGTASGTSTRSNAITTLKNGRTTLTNKLWASGTPTLPVSDPNASGGEALVVEGNTRLKGIVVIEQPQGDIAMGLYGTSAP